MINRFRDAIKAKLQAERDTVADAVAAGQCQDFAEYKSKAGRVAALDDAIAAVDAAFLKITGRDQE